MNSLNASPHRFPSTTDSIPMTLRVRLPTLVCYKTGILTPADTTEIIAGLEGIRSDIEKGAFDWQVALEDVHEHRSGSDPAHR